MQKFVVLLRAINVGGKNKIPMAELKTCLETQGFSDVKTYIQSGNVLLSSEFSTQEVMAKIEAALAKTFTLDSAVKVLVLSESQLYAVVRNKPEGFGDKPDTYHSDVIFLLDITPTDALKVFSPKEGVDTIWLSDGVIYSQRLSARRTESRLNKIMGTAAYRNMTIRNWNTTTKLVSLLKAE